MSWRLVQMLVAAVLEAAWHPVHDLHARCISLPDRLSVFLST